MRIFGLIGYPLSHSFSPTYFAKKFQRLGIHDATYRAFPLEKVNHFKDLLQRQPNLQGLNVTIPYKQNIMPYLHQIDAAAKAVGAVNTIKFGNDGQLTGYNTDIYGFEQSLRPLLQPHHTHALILGTGGAAKAVEYVLQKNNILYKMVSRQPKNNQQISYQQIKQSVMQQYKIIINTTPLGMYPNITTLPTLPYQFVSSHHLFYDLVYNPDMTAFMRAAQWQGATTKNGLEMLHLQAEKAWNIWATD